MLFIIEILKWVLKILFFLLNVMFVINFLLKEIKNYLIKCLGINN